MPLQRVQTETTSREFVLWRHFFEWKAEQDREKVRKEEYYWAQIALEIFNLFRKKRVGKISDFLIKFTYKDDEKQDKRFRAERESKVRSRARREERRKARQERMQQSKNFWLGAVMQQQATTTKRRLPDKVKQATKSRGESK